jgi:glucuronokinase
MGIHCVAHARAGLAGNPSDGYYGKTVSVTIPAYRAAATVRDARRFEIACPTRPVAMFDGYGAAVRRFRTDHPAEPARIVQAALAVFYDYAQARSYDLEARKFALRYKTDIPCRLGMGGSSAIATAVMRALAEFYEVRIDKPLLPTLALRVETDEMGLAAGLQDRVIQVYGGCVYMDFERDHLDAKGYGRYEPLDAATLPPLYVAHRGELSEGSDVVHRDLRDRWERGDPDVREAMKQFAHLAEQFRDALRDSGIARLKDVMNQNFDLRARICRIRPGDRALIDVARGLGASAKFCGSGGAIVGIYDDPDMYEALVREMNSIGARVVKVNAD